MLERKVRTGLYGWYNFRVLKNIRNCMPMILEKMSISRYGYKYVCDDVEVSLEGMHNIYNIYLDVNNEVCICYKVVKDNKNKTNVKDTEADKSTFYYYLDILNNSIFYGDVDDKVILRRYGELIELLLTGIRTGYELSYECGSDAVGLMVRDIVGEFSNVVNEVFSDDENPFSCSGFCGLYPSTAYLVGGSDILSYSRFVNFPVRVCDVYYISLLLRGIMLISLPRYVYRRSRKYWFSHRRYARDISCCYKMTNKLFRFYKKIDKLEYKLNNVYYKNKKILFRDRRRLKRMISIASDEVVAVAAIYRKLTMRRGGKRNELI